MKAGAHPTSLSAARAAAVESRRLPGYLGVVGADAAGVIHYVSPELARFEVVPEEAVGTNIAEHVHPDHRVSALTSFAGVGERPGHHQALELRLVSRDPAGRLVDVVADNRLADPDVGLVVFNLADPDDRLRSARLLQAQADVVRQMALGGPVTDTIREVMAFVESALPGYLAVAYLRAVENPDDESGRQPMEAITTPAGAPLRPLADEIAAHQDLPSALALRENEIVIAADLTEARWQDAPALLRSLAGCVWAAPIRYDRDGVSHGVIAIYGPDPAHPRDDEWAILHLASRMTAIAIDHARMQRRLRRDALVDPLTTVANRRLLESKLAQALEPGPLGQIICFIDLDRLKIINDSLGHEAGDLVIREAAHRLTSAIGGRGVLGRFGGDEFVAVLPAGAVGHAELAQRCLDAFDDPIDIGGRRWQVSVSIGVVVVTEPQTSTEVLRDADAAMYVAKRAGRGCWRLFDTQTRDRVLRRMSLETSLRQAIPSGDMVAHGQPLVRARDWAASGVEVLARWQAGGGIWVPPSEFISLAEEIGLIDDLGAQMLDHAAAAIAALDSAGQVPCVSVNVSPLQLQSDRLFDHLRGLGARARQHLCLEMTEQHMVDDSDRTLERVERLAHQGVRLAIDDFGTGYSSLGALHRMPARILKIDRRLIGRVGSAAGDAVVSAAIGVARAYGMRTVAEGVETVEQAMRLRDLSVDLMQGFLFAVPAPLDDVLDRLRRPWPWAVPREELHVGGDWLHI